MYNALFKIEKTDLADDIMRKYFIAWLNFNDYIIFTKTLDDYEKGMLINVLMREFKQYPPGVKIACVSQTLAIKDIVLSACGPLFGASFFNVGQSFEEFLYRVPLIKNYSPKKIYFLSKSNK